MKRPFAFIVTDPRYLYPVAVLIVCFGVAMALWTRDSTHVSRAGNFIIGTGVWMGLSYTFREGLNRKRDALDASPTLPGTGSAVSLNPAYFTNIAYRLRDAQLQVHGFALVITGSLVGSYGDLAIKCLLPGRFNA